MNPRRDDVAMNERSAIIETAIRPLRCSRGKGLMSKFESLAERVISSPAECKDASVMVVRAAIVEVFLFNYETSSNIPVSMFERKSSA